MHKENQDDRLMRYHDMVNSFWKFLKEHFPPEDTDGWWQQTVLEGQMWVDHYGGGDFARHMMIDLLNELQRNRG